MSLCNRLLLTTLLISVTVPSVGQDLKESSGHITAFACVPLPTPLIVDVYTSDGSSQSDRLRRALLGSLIARQAVVSSDASLRLTLHVRSMKQSVVGSMRRNNQIGGVKRVEERVWIRVDLWSNRRNSVIGGKRYQRAALTEEIQIEIMLDSQINGQCIWQGMAVSRLEGRDEIVAAEKLISMLVDRLGRSVRAEPIKLE